VFSISMAGAVRAGAAEGQRCSLGSRYPLTSVASYTTEEHGGYTEYKTFRGAELYVPAQPGLTQEWLQRTVESDIASGACDFGVPSVTVSVVSAGPGFAVRLSGNDNRSAAEILRHAQQLKQ
jgi:hypothetical protein